MAGIIPWEAISGTDTYRGPAPEPVRLPARQARALRVRKAQRRIASGQTVQPYRVVTIIHERSLAGEHIERRQYDPRWHFKRGTE